MLGIRRWQSRRMVGDRRSNRLAHRDDFRLDPLEEMAVGLSAAPHRLREELTPGNVKPAKNLGEAIERWQPIVRVSPALSS